MENNTEAIHPVAHLYDSEAEMLRSSTLALAVSLALITAQPVAAQNRSIFVLAGYGSAGYEAAISSEFPNDFTVSVSPVILYTMGRDIVFETELEFGLSGTQTTTALEYAQIDYLGFENVQVIAGKFLVPFGVFGERLHPTWINKLPTAPVLFGHAHQGVAESGLLPIMSDAGVMMRWAQPLGSGIQLDFSGYVTQGPRLAAAEEGEHAGDEHDPTEPDDDHAPPVAFGVSFDDNNRDKMVGARLGLVKGPAFEVYLSGFRANYDEDGTLDYRGGAFSVEWRRGPLEFRGEAVTTRQEFVVDSEVESLKRAGYYAQVSRRMGSWEPVIRWGQLSDGTVASEATIDGHYELAVGLNFWLEPTIPVKVAWEFHQDRDDRVYVQWAYGF